MKWLAVLLLLVAAQASLSPAIAQTSNITAASALSNNLAIARADAAAANSRATAAEQKLQQQLTIDDAEGRLRNDAYSLFQVVAGLFGVLTTAIVVFFALRQNHEARAAAREIARVEMESVRNELTKLHAGVDQAREERERQASEIRDTLARVREIEITAAASAKKTAGHAATSQEAAIKASKALKDVERQAAGDRTLPITDEQRDVLVAAAEENKNTAQSQWSLDQFRAAINKALFIDSDWPRATDLARDLIEKHAGDNEALFYGLDALGWAESKQQHWLDALKAYERLISLIEATGDITTLEYVSVVHQKGYVLNELGRNAEAETLLRELMPLRETLNGGESPETLLTQQNLAFALLSQGRPEAEKLINQILEIRERLQPDESVTLSSRCALTRAMLDQGRAKEAEVILRELLPIVEEVEGADSVTAYIVRLTWADSLIGIGNPTGAQAALEVIPNPVPDNSWLARYEAALSFTRGRVADALGNPGVADDCLSNALAIFSTIYPSDHFRARQVEEYVASRKSPKSEDA